MLDSDWCIVGSRMTLMTLDVKLDWNRISNWLDSPHHRVIRSLKSRDPKEFWKIIQTECKQNSNGISSLIFTGFIDHFRELNSDSRFSGYKPQSNTSLVPENGVINYPFTLLKIKVAIKLLKNNKACGVVVVVCPLQPSSSVNSGCPGPESSVPDKFTCDSSLG